MNLLLPSAGNKVFLAQMLGDAVRQRGGKLVAADLDTTAPALAEADIARTLPRQDSPGFLDSVNTLLKEEEIAAVIPARDAELAWWARHHEGGKLAAPVFLSPAATLETCLDKLALHRVANQAGVPCPATDAYTGEGEPPFILKPRYGAGSRGVELIKPGEKPPGAGGDLLVQEYVKGPEYTVDCYALAGGELAATVVRERLEVARGQSVVGRTIVDEELSLLCVKLSKYLRFRGAINIQFIRGADGPRLIDANPRFSGGIAITKAAGMDFARWTVDELCGEQPRIPSSYDLIRWTDPAYRG